MKKILVTGATGQIGSELVPELRRLYGNENVIAAGNKTQPSEELKSGPFIVVDVTNYEKIVRAIKEYEISYKPEFQEKNIVISVHQESSNDYRNSQWPFI